MAMKRINSKFWLALTVLLLVSLACNFAASTASVSDAYMANDEQGDNPTSVFAQDEVFYCLVTLKNAPDDTALKAVWKVVAVEGEEPGMEIDSAELTAGSGKHSFSLSNDNLWPLGTYSVEIYMNDELKQTLEFTVE
jgi:hypothetical protein